MGIMQTVTTHGPKVLVAVVILAVLYAAYKFFGSDADTSITGKEAAIGAGRGVRIFYLSSKDKGYNAPDGTITLAPGAKEGEIRVQAMVGTTDKGKEAATGFQASVLTGGSGVFSGKLGANGKDITVTFAKNAGAGGGTLAIGGDTYTFAPQMP